MWDREEWADCYGYIRYRCAIHGPGWTDCGTSCEYCREDEEEEDLLAAHKVGKCAGYPDCEHCDEPLDLVPDSGTGVGGVQEN